MEPSPANAGILLVYSQFDVWDLLRESMRWSTGERSLAVVMAVPDPSDDAADACTDDRHSDRTVFVHGKVSRDEFRADGAVGGSLVA